MFWCTLGPSTYEKRKNLFEKNKEKLENEIKEMEKHLAMIKFKCWYYEQAMKDGSEENIRKMMPDKLPKEIQELYDLANSWFLSL